MCENGNSKTYQGELNGNCITYRKYEIIEIIGDNINGSDVQYKFVNALPQQKEAEERARRFNMIVNGSDIEKGEVGFDKFGNMYFWRNGAWEFKGNFYNDGAMPKNLNT